MMPVEKKKKILIIDDEPRIRDLYMRVLEEAGFEAKWAPDAQEATNILIREHVDLVLLDINMPGVEGRTMFEVIQEYDPQLKVIVASVYPLHVQKVMIPHAFDYHDKSHGSVSLLEKIYNTI
jgi:DNA-binding NtrC family response regulator